MNPAGRGGTATAQSEVAEELLALTLQSVGTYRLRSLEASVEKTQRTFLKLLFGGLIALTLLIITSWGGHDLYVRWQERRLVRKAIGALQQQDLRSASLAARTALQIKPSSAAAARIAAEVYERSNDRAALDWRRKVVQLEPQSLDDKLAWARCALQFNDIEAAKTILRDVDENGKQAAGYHAVAALLAQTQHQDELARKEWTEAVRLAPNERRYLLQLGKAQLNAKDDADQKAGIAALDKLREDAQLRAEATRVLLNFAVTKQRPASEILKLAHDLAADAGATFTDRLAYVDFLHQANDAEFASVLAELEKRAADKPNELAPLLAWMAQNKLNLLALDYVKTLPEPVLQRWPVPAALADIYVRLNDWHKLDALVRTANWGDFDFLRHAFFARALQEQDDPAGREREWGAALKGARATAEGANVLMRTISEWRWQNEMVDVLWALSSQRDKQNEAFLTLYRYYANAGDTRGLYKVLARLYEVDSENRDVENNLAQISLLLHVDVDQARRLANDVYKAAPNNAAYATTYAYSLMRDGDVAAALRVMNSLTETQLRDPSISAYYGIVLAETGAQRAIDFLERGRAAALLPEEKEAVDKALTRLHAPISTTAKP